MFSSSKCLFFLLHFLELTCAHIIVFVDIMGPRPRCKDIDALCDRLHDEPMELETSGSIKEHDVSPDKSIEPWDMQAVSGKLVPTQM